MKKSVRSPRYRLENNFTVQLMEFILEMMVLNFDKRKRNFGQVTAQPCPALSVAVSSSWSESNYPYSPSPMSRKRYLT